MFKKFCFCFLLIVFLQPVFLSGQALPFDQIEGLIAGMEKSFNEIDYEPTPEEEYYLGRAVAANILSEYKLLAGNQELTHYLNLICQALAINFPFPLPYNGYKVAVLDSSEFNAFATPGGHIFLTKGLIDSAPSEDAIAAIIAHELAHIMLKHGTTMISELKIFETADQISQQASAFTGRSNQSFLVLQNAINDFAHSFIKNGYSAPQEFEADTFALGLLALTGYSPNGLLEMLTVLQRVQGNQTGGFNSTHPTPEQRISNVNSKLPNYRVQDTTSARIQRFLEVGTFRHLRGNE